MVRRLPASRLSAGRLLASLLLCGCLALPAMAEPRFVSVLPGPTTGEWTATLSGASGTPALFADGTPLNPAGVTAANGLTTVTLRGLPATVRFLGAADPGQTAPEAAVLLATAPEPVNSLAIYHIFVGHFANGDRNNDREGLRGNAHKLYVGGDLQGVLKQIDYIAGLGVTAVWLSPIFTAETDHGYDVMNYFQIGGVRAVPRDPDASLALFRQVRDALQARGIKVILDVPLNHAHSNYDRRKGDPRDFNPKATGAKQTAEKTWEGWGAKFRYWDMDDAGTRAFLTDVALHWLVTEKVDGLRLDYVRGVDKPFWAELYRTVKAAKPDAVLIGEAWDDAAGPAAQAEDIAGYLNPVAGIGPQFDAAFDFSLQTALTDGFAKGASLDRVEKWLQSAEAMWGRTGRSTYFLDNHDVSRFGAWAGDDARVTAAVGFISALSGPISLFYGTETGLAGPAPKRGFNDEARIPMPWDGLNRPMVDMVSSYLKARRDHPVLYRGARLPLLAGPDTLVMAKRESGPGGTTVALVGVNLGAADQTLTVPLAGLLAPGTILTPLAGGGPAPLIAGGTLTWTLPARTTQYAITMKD
jgi:cyclomaltodextrinase / maltogenic alpha-amylase / neopullulanase